MGGTLDLPVNGLIGPPSSRGANPAATESRVTPGPANPVTLGGESGVEWVVAMLALGALVVLILFRLAGFQAALAVRVGG